jgi:exopolysaccharide biosynthesis polyprenyl glycosylphosphotransferase
MIIASAVFLLVFQNLGLYRPRRGRLGITDEFYSIMVASSLAVLILMAITFFYRGSEYSRLVLILAWGISTIFLGSSRVSLGRFEEKMRARGIGAITVLVVGTGSIAKMIEERIHNHPGLGYQVMGFLDDDSGKTRGGKVLGKIEDLALVCREKGVEMAIIALSSPTHDKLMDVVNRCLSGKVPFRVVSNLFDIVTGPLSVEEIDGVPVFGLKEGPLQGWNKFLKRAIDVSVSLIGLIITFPLFIVIAVLVKFTSPGPVFFAQERVGQGGSVFRICKFRSMRVDAEAETGPVWAKGNDARITRGGHWLRRFSLDELPQLWCVLKGDMSLIGPRPERPVFVEQFRQSVLRYAERHKVKPGLTGWAQVNGFRGNTAIDERTGCDLYYIDNWSLFFDFKILVKTFFEFIFHKHAY